MNEYVDDSIDTNRYIKWFSVICFILILIICSVFNIDEEEHSWFLWFWTIGCCGIYIWLAIPVYNNFLKIDKFKKFPLCGNKITNIKFDTYHSTANTLKVTSILSIIFLNFQLLCNIVIIILRYTVQYGDMDYEPQHREPFVNKNSHYSTNIDYNKPPEEPYYNNNNNPPEQPYYSNPINNNGNDPYYNSSDFNQNNNGVSGVDNPNPDYRAGYSNY